MNKLLSKIRNRLNADGTGGIFKNMMILATGTTAAKGIGFLSSLVLTRIFAPESFGILSLFIAFTSLIAPISTLCYSYAVPLPRSRYMAVNIMMMNLGIIIIMTLITLIVFLTAGEKIFSMANAHGLEPYIWLIVLTQFAGGIYETLSSYATRIKAFKPIAKTKINQSFIGSAIKILSGFTPLGVTGLLIGQAYAQAGSSFTYIKVFKDQIKDSLKHITLKRTMRTARFYADFPMYRLPSQFLLTFSIQAPLLLTGKIFGVATVGQLGLAISVLSLPVILFGVSAGQAYYAETAAIGANNPRKIYDLSKQVAKKLFLLSLIPFAILQIAGEPLFVLVFGKPWHQAGQFASMLSVSLLAQFVVVPIINILTVLGKQKMFLMFNIMRTISIVAVFSVCGYYKLTENTVIFIYSLVLALNYLIMSVSIFRIIRSRF
ncbi:MAG: lipopolysaccharide biosynthesis protein [Deferribacterales bacterium]